MAKVYETLQFGRLEIRDEDEVFMAEGLLGFSHCKRFVILEDPAQAPFQWLQSLDNTDLSFVLVDPLLLKADYQIQVPKEEVRELELEDPKDARVFVIVVVPQDVQQVTANLKGPVVINPKNRRAKQVILMDEQYPTRYPFLVEMQKEELKEKKE